MKEITTEKEIANKIENKANANPIAKHRAGSLKCQFIK